MSAKGVVARQVPRRRGRQFYAARSRRASASVSF